MSNENVPANKAAKKAAFPLCAATGKIDLSKLTRYGWLEAYIGESSDLVEDAAGTYVKFVQLAELAASAELDAASRCRAQGGNTCDLTTYGAPSTYANSTAGVRIAASPVAPESQATPNCLGCGHTLKKVTQGADSMLNAEQFDAARAGDWFCDSGCTDKRYRYFWNRDLAAQVARPLPTVPPMVRAWCEAEQARLDAVAAHNAAFEAAKQFEWPGPCVNAEFQAMDKAASKAHELKAPMHEQLTAMIAAADVAVGALPVPAAQKYPEGDLRNAIYMALHYYMKIAQPDEWAATDAAIQAMLPFVTLKAGAALPAPVVAPRQPFVLYLAVNELMAELGAHGEIDARSPLADAVMQALHDLDGGKVAQRAEDLREKASMPAGQATKLAVEEFCLLADAVEVARQPDEPSAEKLLQAHAEAVIAAHEHGEGGGFYTDLRDAEQAIKSRFATPSSQAAPTEALKFLNDISLWWNADKLEVVGGNDPVAFEKLMESAELFMLRARGVGSQAAPDAKAELILVPKWAGQFHSYQDWVNKAQTRLASPDHRRAMCVDAKGRRCAIGKDFMQARDEGAFPVRYFWECELVRQAAPAATAEPIKDHNVRQLVNDLREIAITFHAMGQLRERIAGAVMQFLAAHSGWKSAADRAAPAELPDEQRYVWPTFESWLASPINPPASQNEYTRMAFEAGRATLATQDAQKGGAAKHEHVWGDSYYSSAIDGTDRRCECGAYESDAQKGA